MRQALAAVVLAGVGLLVELAPPMMAGPLAPPAWAVLPESAAPQGFTDTPGALWASASGSGSTCSSGSPCTFATAMTTVVDNGTIILNSGTYSGDITITGSNHDGITITATAAVKNALVWTCQSSLIFDGASHQITDCGIVSGTDNRPLFSDTSVSIGVTSSGSTTGSGSTISYLRLDGGTARNGFGEWVVGVEAGATDVTLDHNEIRDGGGGIAFMGGIRHRFTNNYIHNHGADGWPTCTDNDAHGIATYHFASGTRQPGWVNPTVGNGVLIKNNTLEDNQGDGFQDVGDQSVSLFLNYAILDGNHVYHNCEQGIDHKGARNHIIRFNDVDTNGTDNCQACGGVSTNDNDGPNYQHLDWWVYGNYIHGMTTYGLMSQEGDDGRWMVWNNFIYDNCQAPFFNNVAAAQQIPPNSRFEHNVVVNNTNLRGSGQCTGFLSEQGSTVLVRNNIFQGNGLSQNGNVSGFSNATVANNRCSGAASGGCGTGAETSTAVDFVDGVGPVYDFHLQAATQSIGAGTTLTANDGNHTILTDADGYTRPFGSLPDHGAYEFGAGPPPGGSTPRFRLRIRGEQAAREYGLPVWAQREPPPSGPPVRSASAEDAAMVCALIGFVVVRRRARTRGDRGVSH